MCFMSLHVLNLIPDIPFVAYGPVYGNKDYIIIYNYDSV